ncbi:hypothetical protein NOVO_06840 [Rickettsiales bacterium Ac37b]|nr:hypothetical protein NOVO_06840 [Rickettsiales bacterium Ac37b]
MLKTKILKHTLLDDFSYQSSKNSGIEEGGVYKLRTSHEVFFIKKMNKISTISEYIGSHIARFLIGDKAPLVELVKDRKGNVYTASKAIDLFLPLDDYLPYNNANSDLLSNSQMSDIAQLEEVNIVMEFVDHHDMHGGNLGVIVNNTEAQSAVVDFSQSLKFSNNAIKYYYHGYDNKKIINSLEKVINIPKAILNDKLEGLFNNLKFYYNHKIDHHFLECYKAKIIKSLLHRQELFKDEKILIELNHALEKKIISHLNYFESILPYLSFTYFQEKTLAKTINLLVENYGHIKGCGIILKHLLLHIPNNLQAIKNTIYSIIKHDNLEIFDQIFPYLKNTPEYLESALEIAVYDNNQKTFEQILPYLQNSPKYLESALKTAVYNNNQKIFGQLYPYLRGAPEYLEFALKIAVHNNNQKMFDQILPYLKNTPKYLGSALEIAVYNDNQKMFDQIVPYLQGTPEYLGPILEITIYNDNPKMFDQIFPYLKNTPEYLGPALEVAVYNDNPKMFDQIFPYLKNTPEYLGPALEVAVYNDNQKIFDQIFPYLHNTPEHLKSALGAAVYNDNQKIFDQIFSYLQNIHEHLKDIIKISIYHGNFKIFEQTYPHFIDQISQYLEKNYIDCQELNSMFMFGTIDSIYPFINGDIISR